MLPPPLSINKLAKKKIGKMSYGKLIITQKFCCKFCTDKYSNPHTIQSLLYRDTNHIDCLKFINSNFKIKLSYKLSLNYLA